MFGDLNKVHPTHRGHRHEVSPGGGIIYDSSLKLQPESFGRDDIKLFPVPYMDLLIDALKEFGKDRELSKYQVMVNTIALGSSIGLVDYDFDLASEAIKEGFTGRKAALGDLNISAARHGYDYAKRMFGPNAFPIRLRKQALGVKRMMIRGVQSIAIGKLKAGCGFQTYYPITPATDESEYLESHQPDYNMIVVQAEDEISAINMATGAAHAGLRSSTSTSGPGFSLMAEGLGWSGITEAPKLRDQSLFSGRGRDRQLACQRGQNRPICDSPSTRLTENFPESSSPLEMWRNASTTLSTLSTTPSTTKFQ